MTDINPPPELIKDWLDEWNESDQIVHSVYTHIAIRAAQWGADLQLEADAEWLDEYSLDAPHLTITPTGKGLVEAMRPKPPSLKQQALIALDDADLDAAHENILRRALEALPDD